MNALKNQAPSTLNNQCELIFRSCFFRSGLACSSASFKYRFWQRPRWRGVISSVARTCSFDLVIDENLSIPSYKFVLQVISHLSLGQSQRKRHCPMNGTQNCSISADSWSGWQITSSPPPKPHSNPSKYGTPRRMGLDPSPPLARHVPP